MPLPDTGVSVSGEVARQVADELHDGAMQEITLARLQIDLLSAGMTDPRLLEQLGELSDVLHDASYRLQTLMRDIAGSERIV